MPEIQYTNFQYSRIQNRISSVSGTTPTIFTGSTSAFTETDQMVLGNFKSTDILDGEIFVNTADDKVFIRSNDTILELQTSASTHTDNYVTGSTFSADTITLTRNDGVDITTQLTNWSVLKFDTTFTGHSHTEGAIHWDDDDKTLSIDTEANGVSIQVGQEQVVRVVNKTGVQIDNGSVVYINGAQGNRPTVTLADYTTEATSSLVIGIATHDIADNANGYITTFGLVRDLDTSTYSAGTSLYLYTGGTMTDVKPISPNHEVRLGYVITSHATEGIVLCRVQNGYELEELHDVLIDTLTDGQILSWNAASSVWENVSVVDNITTEISGAFGNFTGFPNRVDSTITYDESGTITLSPTTGSTFTFYLKGETITSTGQTFTLGATPYTGYFCYYDSTGTPTVSTTPWDILTDVPVAYAYFSNDYGYSGTLIFEERHSSSRNLEAHREFHEQIGTYYVSGLEIANYTVQPTTPLDSDNQYSIATGVIADEDIRNTLPALTAGTYNIAYRDGSNPDWTFAGDSLPFDWTAGDYIKYNEDTGGGTYTMTNLTNNEYVCYYVFGVGLIGDTITKGYTYSHIVNLPSTNVHANLVDAQAETLGDNDFNGFPFQEICPLYKIIFRTNASYTNAGKCRIASVSRLEGTKINITTTTSWTNNHSALSNLSNDDHLQYVTLADRGGETLNIGSINTTGNVQISGNLLVSGTATTLNTETLLVEDNLIFINNGEIGSGVTAGYAGIVVDRGLFTDYIFEFNETSDTFRIGQSGTTQAVATREDSPINASVPFWNSSTQKFETNANFYWGGTQLQVRNLTIGGSGNIINSSTDLSLAANGNTTTIGGNLTVNGSVKVNNAYTLPTVTGASGSLLVSSGTTTDWETPEAALLSSDLTLDSISATTISADTIYSGSTSLYDIITAISSGTTHIPISDLSDVTISTPTAGQLLTYTTGGTWNNVTPDFWFDGRVITNRNISNSTAGVTVADTVKNYLNSPSNEFETIEFTLSNSIVEQAAITIESPIVSASAAGVNMIEVVVDFYWNDEGSLSETWLALSTTSGSTNAPDLGWYQIAKDSEANSYSLCKASFNIFLNEGVTQTVYVQAISTGTVTYVYSGNINASGAWSNSNDLAKPFEIKAIYKNTTFE